MCGPFYLLSIVLTLNLIMYVSCANYVCTWHGWHDRLAILLELRIASRKYKLIPLEPRGPFRRHFSGIILYYERRNRSAWSNNIGWATIYQCTCVAPFYCVRYVKENCFSSVNEVVKSFYDNHSWFNSFTKADILDNIWLSFLRDLKHSSWFGVNSYSIPKMITIQ